MIKCARPAVPDIREPAAYGISHLAKASFPIWREKREIINERHTDDTINAIAKL